MADEPGPSDGSILAGGLQVLAGSTAVVGGPYDGKIVPLIIFRFHSPDGGVYPDVMLAVDRSELRSLWRTVRIAGEAAIADVDGERRGR